jgi:hypothetical protein
MQHKKPKHGHYRGHHDANGTTSHGHHHRHESAAQTSIHQTGMRRREPNAVDASTRVAGPTVNDGATRGGVARTPGTLGPRSA